MTELDRLDPPPKPRAPRRRKGEAETAVRHDLGKMPEELRKSAVAATSLLLARQLDEGAAITRDTPGHLRKIARLLSDDEMTGQEAAGLLLQLAGYVENGLSARDAAGHAREIRMGTTQLREWNPGGQEGDKTDEARAQVEQASGLYVVPGG
jgi:hypothetical protein